MMRSITIVIAGILLLLVSAVRAENWPEFRGPNGEGFFRISLTTPDERLTEAVARLGRLAPQRA